VPSTSRLCLPSLPQLSIDRNQTFNPIDLKVYTENQQVSTVELSATVHPDFNQKDYKLSTKDDSSFQLDEHKFWLYEHNLSIHSITTSY
jgi:hypothetical protein